MELMAKVKAVIFDMDGTIIHTKEIWQKSKIEALTNLGAQPFRQEHYDFLESLTNLSSKDSANKIKSFFNFTHSEEKIMVHIREITNKNFEHTKINFVEGFESFHQKLQDFMVPTALATNAELAPLSVLVKTLQLQRFFGKHIYSQVHVNSAPKPDPALFLHAAQQLRVKPEECIVFEDSSIGFQAAKAAGMKCIAIKNINNQQLLDQVLDAITNYHEAENALKRITL